MTLPITPSQTVGPFFGYGLPYAEGPFVVPEWRPDAITLHGRVTDGASDPLPDAMVEIWQPDAAGTIPRAVGALARKRAFTGFGRCDTDADGAYHFATLKPGAVEGAGAPHIAVLVFARGLLKPVATRLYFPDEPANATDPLLASLPPDRRATLIALPDGDRAYRFDVRLQGNQETVFLAL